MLIVAMGCFCGLVWLFAAFVAAWYSWYTSDIEGNAPEMY